MKWVKLFLKHFLKHILDIEVYSEPYRSSKMELFAKIVSG